MTIRADRATASSGDARARTVGIVGGMGPLATADFYRRMVEATLAEHDQDHLRVIIDSHPQIPDRSGAREPGGADEDPVPAIIDSIALLEGAGAELIVMACNAAYGFRAEVAAAATVPIVDWPREAARGVCRQQPGVATIGVLATDGTIAHGLYHEAFQALGVAVLTPIRGSQQRVMATVYGRDGVKAGGQDRARLRDELQAVATELALRGADALLLACTELSVIDATCPVPWPVPTWDAAEIVARRTVHLAGGRLRAGLTATAGDRPRDWRDPVG